MTDQQIFQYDENKIDEVPTGWSDFDDEIY